MMSTTEVQRADAIPALSHARWIEIGRAENAALSELLRSLDETEWSHPTDCDGWDVKDIVAHTLGMAQGFTSFSELRRQLVQAKKRKHELGNQLNAMNQTQVDDRKNLSPAQLLEQFQPTMDSFIRLRRRVGRPGRFIPMYDSSVLGFTNVRYLFDTVFARDIFMHRIDISRATGREFDFIPEDRELVMDIIRDWARRTRADATVRLNGAMTVNLMLGSGGTEIEGDTVAFCRVLSGRGEDGDVDIRGDGAAAIRWLKEGCPF